MNRSKVLWVFKISHEYFEHSEPNGICLDFAKESSALILRRGVMWRKVKSGEWNLVAFNDQIPFVEDDKIVLELSASDHLLTYVTDWDWSSSKECYELDLLKDQSVIEMKGQVGVKSKALPPTFFRLNVEIGKLIGTQPLLTELSFKTFDKYWEYIFIPRDKNTDRKLKLEDLAGMMTFGESELFEFSGCKCLRCRSNEKIRMKEQPEGRLRLWELFSAGKRELMHLVDYPKPGKFINTSEDTLLQVLYI